jgi:hypothetical protein
MKHFTMLHHLDDSTARASESEGRGGGIEPMSGIRVRMNRDRDSGLPELLFEFQEQQSNKIEPGIGSEQAQRYAQDFVRLYHVLKKEHQHEITN